MVSRQDVSEDIEEIKAASYAELRSRCRELGVPGVGKAEVLRERLLEAVQQRQATDAKGASSIPLNEEPKSPRGGARRRHRKLSSLQQDVRGTAEAAEEEAEDIAHVVRNAAAKGAEDLKEAWDAAKEQIAPITQQPVAETRAEAANYTSNVWSRLKETVAGWVPSGASWQLLLAVFLLGLLAGAGLTMLAHPHAWHDVRHNANNAATSVSDGASGILRSMSRTWSEAFPRGQWADQGGDARVPLHCRAALARAPLTALLPPPDAPLWGHIAADVRALSPPEGGAPLHKGLGLLLVCAAAEECAAAVQGLWGQVPQPCADCLLVVKAVELAGPAAEARGMLQQRLTATLRRCPHALIVIDAAAIAAAPAATLPVLINALSERGHFQAGGQQVPASGAVYVIPMAVPAGAIAAFTQAAGDEDAFKTAAKAALVVALSGSQAAPAGGLAQALRRRLDVVAPIRGAAFAGPDAAVAGAAAAARALADAAEVDLESARSEDVASELHIDYPMQ